MSSKMWLNLTFLLFGAFLLAGTPVTLAVDPSQVNREARRQAPPVAALARTAPLIADHTTTDLSQIPPYWIEQAKATLRLSYGHTSHGSQIVSGMNVLMADPLNNHLYDFDDNGAIVSGVLSLADYTPSGDLGNPDRTSWASRTRTYLNGTGSNRNVVVWSWCGQAGSATEADINTYLSLMNQLEIDYPNVTFIYMTGHLDGSGIDGNLNRRNEQIRNYVRANNKVLFDFADIESYDPDGNYFLDHNADDEADYDGGNWATEWCNAHPGDPLCRSCSCAHSKPLNCNLKVRAFWWLLARLAGWDGQVEPTLDLHTSPADQSLYLTWTVDITLPATTTWRIDYDGPVGNPPSPITDIISFTRAYSLSNLTNYTWYTVTLRAMLEATPFLTDTVQAMPTDHLMYLPIILKTSTSN